MKLNEEYFNNLERYTVKDGIKAIVAYVILLVATTFWGWLHIKRLHIPFNENTVILIPVIFIVAGLLLIGCSKKGLRSIGIQRKNLGSSVMLGALGAILLFAILIIWLLVQRASIGFMVPYLGYYILVIINAFYEEIWFRGYIQTRIAGIIKTWWAASMVVAGGYLLIHYSVMLITLRPFSSLKIMVIDVAGPLLLHFFSDLIYKKTNCLWGSITLNLLYYVVRSLIYYVIY